MTWASASGRDFRFETCATPKNVGPGSYTIPGTVISPKRQREPKRAFEPRQTLPTPDILTPGPGYYDIDLYYKEKQRPQSSIFQSRSGRNFIKTDNGPSSADHGQITPWGRSRPIYSTPHHPHREKRPPSYPDTCNYLDEKGRLIHKPELKHTSEDIGPGSYDDHTIPRTRYTEINLMERETASNWINKQNIPGPGEYEEFIIDTKLPVTIKGERIKERPREISQEMTPPTVFEAKRPKKPNPEFKSVIPRDIFAPPKDKVPGPPDHSSELPKKKPHIFKGLAFGTKAIRFDKSDNQLPGPSDYSIAQQSTTRCVTSVFQSRSTKKDATQPTPDEIGPGSYNLIHNKTCPRKSPAFQSEDIRMGNDDNGVPSPADYNIKRDVDRPKTMICSRYPNVGDWIADSITCSPSPEEFTINRDLAGPLYSFPHEKSKTATKTRKTDKIGPGSYNVDIPFVKPSYNATVPKKMQKH